MGANFAEGRGNVLAAVEWAKRDAVMQRDRDFYVAGWTIPARRAQALNDLRPVRAQPGECADAGRGEQRLRLDRHQRSTTHQLLLQSRRDALQAVAGASLQQRRKPGTKLQSNNALGQADRTGMASSPLTRYSIFSRGTFKFNDNVTAFIQGNLSSFTVSQVLGYAPATSFWGASVPRDACTRCRRSSQHFSIRAYRPRPVAARSRARLHRPATFP